MDSLLESILKASAESAMQQQGGQSRQAAGDPIADLLGGILGGGATPQRQPAPQAQDPIADILGGILGGGNAQQAMPRQQPAPGGMGIEDLIGGLIGGNASQGQPHQNGIADMIGAILGGGAGGRGGAGNNIIAEMLSEKLGIPPALAQAAVAFFMAKMFERQMTRQQRPSGQGGIFEPRRQAETDGGLDLDDLLDSMGDGNTLGMKFNNSGMASDLAKQTGMSPDQANKALQEIVNIVGQQRTRPRPVTAKGADLKGLLDSWD